MFEQSQIQEFKEAFGMIDANQDGFIDKDWIHLISAVIYRRFSGSFPRFTVFFQIR